MKKMVHENKNKKRSVRDYVYGRPLRNYLYGRLDGELAKEDEKRKTIRQRVAYNFRNAIKGFWVPSDDDKKRLMRKDLGAIDKFLLSFSENLLPGDAVKLMFSDDPEVRKLQRKTIDTSLRYYNDPDDELKYGTLMRKALQNETDKPLDEVCKKGIPKYLYEPNVRYKRTENPNYKRHRNYSIAGILTGTGLLAIGLASFNYALAYAGAALTLASFGYQSGQWTKKRKTDQNFEKLPLSLSGLEKKVQKPGNPDSHYLSNHAGSLSDITAKEAYKDDALYVRRLYKAETPMFMAHQGWSRLPFHYANLANWNSPLYSGWGALGTALTAVAAISAGFCYYPSDAAISLAIAGSTGLATLGHYAGYIFGGKVAEYRKV